jgi:hypothetical protein
MAKKSPIPKGPRYKSERVNIDEPLHIYGQDHFRRLREMQKRGMSRGPKERNR